METNSSLYKAGASSHSSLMPLSNKALVVDSLWNIRPLLFEVGNLLDLCKGFVDASIKATRARNNQDDRHDCEREVNRPKMLNEILGPVEETRSGRL